MDSSRLAVVTFSLLAIWVFEVRSEIKISALQSPELSFGQVVVAGAGSVTVSPSGTSSYKGRVTDGRGSREPSRGVVQVSGGEPEERFQVVLIPVLHPPVAGAEVTLTTNLPDNLGSFNSRGRASFSVGGTIRLPAGAPTRDYRVDYTVDLTQLH